MSQSSDLLAEPPLLALTQFIATRAKQALRDPAKRRVDEVMRTKFSPRLITLDENLHRIIQSNVHEFVETLCEYNVGGFG